MLSHPVAAGAAVFAVGTALRRTRALDDTRGGELLWSSLAVAGGVSLFRYGLPHVTVSIAHEGAVLRAVGDGIARVGDGVIRVGDALDGVGGAIARVGDGVIRVGDALDGVGDGVRDVGSWCATLAQRQERDLLRRPVLRRFARQPPRALPPS